MASPSIKSNRMKRTESKKSHSWWWDSHISPKNSKWLQENLEEMDQNVKRMLKLIEEDADSFAKKAELYFKKRPELISLVEEFYRIYRSLAERYDNVTGELRKNIPSDLQSQGSGISDNGSEPPSPVPSPDRRPGRTKSGPRAAGFDVFLGSDKSGSNRNNKEGDDESLTLDSDMESDDESSVNNYNGEEHGLLRDRISELEAELRVMKEKAHPRKEEIYEEELRVAREEIARLMVELQKYENIDNSVISEGVVYQRGLEFIEYEQSEPKVVQESVDGSEIEVGFELTIRTLEEELRVTSEKLCESEEELAKKGTIVQGLQDQLMLAQKEIPVWKKQLDAEKQEVLKLQERMTRYKNNLSERDQEIRGLKEAISNANKSLSDENKELQAEITRVTKERIYLEDHLKELNLRCQSLEDDARLAKASRAEVEIVFGNRIELLKADISERDRHVEELNKKLDNLKAAKDIQITQMGEHLNQLHLQHVELIAGADLARRSAKELRLRVEELEKEVEGKQEMILEGEEGKREAIRQLSFSLEHYRAEYYELRRVMVQKRSAMMAA